MAKLMKIAFRSKFITNIALDWILFALKQLRKVCSSQTNRFSPKILNLIAQKRHFNIMIHVLYMVLEGGTPLNKPPIEIHAF